jgi:hypothetical protein
MMAFTPTSVGQLNGTGSVEAAFLSLVGTEVLHAFENSYKMSPMLNTKQVKEGTLGTKFPYITTTQAELHARGVEVDGQDNIERHQREIKIDRPETVREFIDEQDEWISDIAVRQHYTMEMGRALAEARERKAMQSAVLAARTASTNAQGAINYVPGGSVVTHANARTDINQFLRLARNARVIMNKKKVPMEDRYLFVDPDLYDLLLDAKDLIDTNYRGSGSIAEAEVKRVAGFTIVETLYIPTTNITAQTGNRNIYHGDFTKTVAIAMQKKCLGVAELKGVTTDILPQPRALGTLLMAHQSYGIAPIHPECAVEIALP